MKTVTKYLLVFLIGLFATSVNAAIIPQGGAAEDSDGTVKAGTIDKWYIKVKNGQGSDLNAGEVLCIDDGDDDGYSADYCAASGDSALCVLDADCSSGSFCKCQVYGINSSVELDVTGGNTTAGEPVFVYSTGGAVSGNTSESSTGDYPIGIALDTASSSGTVEVFIKLLGS